MPRKEESDALNPYAVSNAASSSDSYLTKPNPEFFEIEFSGTVDTGDVRHYVFNPYMILLKIFIPCIAILFLTFQIFTTRMPLVIPVAIVAVLMVGVVSYVTHASLFSVDALLKKRPWLIGQIHGIVRQERMTVRYAEVQVESFLDISQCITRHGMFMPPTNRPLAILPTHCFYENEWADFIRSSSSRQNKPLEPLGPENGAIENLVETDRIQFLDQRRSAYRFKLSGLGFWLAVIVQVALVFVPVLTSFAMHVVSFFVIMLGTEAIRIMAMISNIHRQFSANRKGYRPPHSPSAYDQEVRYSMSWFNADALVHCGSLRWMRFPIRLCDRIIIDVGAIEFRFQDLSFVFHREGFENEERWQQACELARTLRS